MTLKMNAQRIYFAALQHHDDDESGSDEDDDDDDMEDELEQLRHALASDRATRARVIREVLSHAREVMHSDEEAAGYIVYILLEAIVDQRSDDVRKDALEQVLRVLSSIEDKEEQMMMSTLFLNIILMKNNEDHRHILYYVVSFMNGHSGDERADSLAFILRVIASHDNEYDRNAFLQVFFSIVQGHGGNDRSGSRSGSRSYEMSHEGDDSNEMMNDLGRFLADRLEMGEEERSRVILALLHYAMTQQPEVMQHINYLVIDTVMSHSSSQVRRHGIALILHAISQIQDRDLEEAASRDFIHYAMEQHDPARVEEFFDVLGMLIAQIESPQQRLDALTFIAESIALHPNKELRRAVLSELLVALMSGADRVGDDVMQRLMEIIEGSGGNRGGNGGRSGGDDDSSHGSDDDSSQGSDDDSSHGSDDDSSHGSDEQRRRSSLMDIIRGNRGA